MEENMTSINFRCTKEFKANIIKLSHSMGLTQTDLIIKLCLDGRVSDISKQHRNQVEILYNVNAVRYELNKVSSYISTKNVLDEIALESLIVIEKFIEDAMHGK